MQGIAPKQKFIPGVESSNAPVANTVFITGTATLCTEILGTDEPGFTVTGIRVKNDGTAFGGSGSNYAIVELWKTPAGGTITLVGSLNIPAALAANTTAYANVCPTTPAAVTAAGNLMKTNVGNYFGPGDTLSVILNKAGTPVKSGGTAQIYLDIE